MNPYAANRRLYVWIGIQHILLHIQQYGLLLHAWEKYGDQGTYYCQLEAGKSSPKKQKKCYTNVDKQIFKIVNDYL